MDMVKLCQKFKGQVVALDLAGDESKPLTPEHIEAFQVSKVTFGKIQLHVKIKGYFFFISSSWYANCLMVVSY